MPKFKHRDEEDFEFFCEICGSEHSASIPESTCRKSVGKHKDRIIAEWREERWNREDQKRLDWED